MKIPNLYTYSKDLRDLYIKTQNKDIESLFIQAALSYEDSLRRWLLSANFQNSKSYFKNPDVHEALRVLAQLENTHGGRAKIASIVDFFYKSKSKHVLPVIASFARIDNEVVESILSPFKGILAEMSTLSYDLAIPLESVTEDLMTAYNLFVEERKVQEKEKTRKKTKKTKKEKRMEMFTSLLKMFSNDIKDAAQRSGFEDFSNAIASGALLNINSINSYISTDVTTFGWSEARRLVKHVLSRIDPANINSNYNFVKEHMLDFSGVISQAEINQLNALSQPETDFSQYMGEEIPDNVVEEPINPISLTDAQLLNGSYLSMLSAFFMIFHEEVKK